MTYKCFLCKQEKILESETFLKKADLVVPAPPARFHRVVSSVSGGGLRDCGPCLEEK